MTGAAVKGRETKVSITPTNAAPNIGIETPEHRAKFLALLALKNHDPGIAWSGLEPPQSFWQESDKSREREGSALAMKEVFFLTMWLRF